MTAVARRCARSRWPRSRSPASFSPSRPSLARSTARSSAPAARDLITVGSAPASVNALAEPIGLCHEPLGRALARIAAARPRAIGLDFPLPERSYDPIRPGVDRTLLVGLAAAVQNGPFVAVLNIDAN